MDTRWGITLRQILQELMCFVRKVCRFAMKGLPLGLQETTSGFQEPSTGLDERATSYYAYSIMRPVISQKRAIDPKVGRIARKICREKSCDFSQRLAATRSSKSWPERPTFVRSHIHTP